MVWHLCRQHVHVHRSLSHPPRCQQLSDRSAHRGSGDCESNHFTPDWSLARRSLVYPNHVPIGDLASGRIRVDVLAAITHHRQRRSNLGIRLGGVGHLHRRWRGHGLVQLHVRRSRAKRDAGAVVGRRSALVALTSVVTSFVCGRLLDSLIFPLNYQIVFVLGFIGMVISGWHLGRIRKTDSSATPPTPAQPTIKLRRRCRRERVMGV